MNRRTLRSPGCGAATAGNTARHFSADGSLDGLRPLPLRAYAYPMDEVPEATSPEAEPEARPARDEQAATARLFAEHPQDLLDVLREQGTNVNDPVELVRAVIASLFPDSVPEE